MTTRIIISLVLIALLAGLVVLTHDVLTAPYPGHNDFISRWEPARAYWLDGLNPYGEEASLRTQTLIYGGAAAPDQDPGYFAYPFYTVFVVWPLVYLDYAWASAVWMVLLEVVIIASLALLLDIFRWKPGPLLLAALLLGSLMFYFSMRGLLLGQPGLLVYFLEVVALWALVKKRDNLGGAALALSTLKPQMGFLIVPFLLLWALREKRWRFVAAFGAVFGVLMLASFALLPSWLGDWLDQLRLYTGYTALGSPVWIIMQYYLNLGSVGEWAVNLLLYGFMLWAWYGVLVQRQAERWLWAVVVTLTVTHLTALRTATPHYVVFIIPLVFYGALWRRRWLLNALALAALLIIPWVHFLATVEGEFEHPTVYLPLPLLILALLWFTRRQWWAWRAGEGGA